MNATRRQRPASALAQKRATLFVIPFAQGRAIAWAGSLAAVAEIRAGEATVPIMERKRLHQVGSSLEVLVIESPDLRDGTPCKITVHTDGGVRVVEAVLSLAPWQDPQTSRVLKFLITRLFERSRSNTAPSLDRYLALVASWQAPARLLNSFPEGQLLEIDADLPMHETSAYAASGAKVYAASLRVLRNADGRSTVWLDGALPQRFYLDIGEQLIEVEPQKRSRPSKRSRSTQTTLPKSTRAELVEALNWPTDAVSSEFANWVTTLCRRQDTFDLDESRLEVIGAVRLPSGELLTVVDLHQNVRLFDRLRVQEFRGSEPQDPAVTSWTIASSGQRATHRRLCLRSSDLPGRVGCHSVLFRFEKEPHEVWIREIAASDPDAMVVAEALWPHCSTNEKLFAEAIQPIVASQPVSSDVHPIQKADFGQRRGSVGAEVVVLAQDACEALHRTIIGLSLTAGKEYLSIRVSTFGADRWDELTRLASLWSKTYDVRIGVDAYATELPEASLTLTRTGRKLVRVFCRAGVVPVRPDWLVNLQAEFEKNLSSLVMGVAPDHQRLSADMILPDDMFGDGFEGPRLDQLLTVAALPAFAGEHPPEADTFQTLEAALLAQALAIHAAGETVSVVPGVSFVHTADRAQVDGLRLMADRLTLNRLATDYRSIKKRRVIKIEPRAQRRLRWAHD